MPYRLARWQLGPMLTPERSRRRAPDKTGAVCEVRVVQRQLKGADISTRRPSCVGKAANLPASMDLR